LKLLILFLLLLSCSTTNPKVELYSGGEYHTRQFPSPPIIKADGKIMCGDAIYFNRIESWQDHMDSIIKFYEDQIRNKDN
jgi:hypothetical protein